MYLVQILLPVKDNEGAAFDAAAFVQTRTELVERFKGITTYTRAPASGVWKPDEQTIARDDLLVYEVMVEALEREWWRTFRRQLEKRFRQESILIRAMETALL